MAAIEIGLVDQARRTHGVASGIEIEDVAVGEGPAAERGQFVSVRWRGTLNRGDPFGEGEVSFRAGGREVVAGLSNGVIGMRVGGVRRLRVSPHLGYRDRRVPGVPPDAVLTFEVELLGISPAAEPAAGPDPAGT